MRNLNIFIKHVRILTKAYTNILIRHLAKITKQITEIFNDKMRMWWNPKQAVHVLSSQLCWVQMTLTDARLWPVGRFWQPYNQMLPLYAIKHSPKLHSLLTPAGCRETFGLIFTALIGSSINIKYQSEDCQWTSESALNEKRWRNTVSCRIVGTTRPFFGQPLLRYEVILLCCSSVFTVKHTRALQTHTHTHESALDRVTHSLKPR